MEFKLNQIDEFTAKEWLHLTIERIKVFVVEQHCPYQEIDDEDSQAYHLRLIDGQQLVAYTRILADKEPIRFGRVLVTAPYRGHGYGQAIVQETIDTIARLFLEQATIEISAQQYLIDFYQSFGFKPISQVYLEDDIPHLDMRLDLLD
ncbi:GNAT family N-acetyltransferase [Ignavigranum ruoffiae]|uniref:GNAT family N-acetyltransferase n=1 Tax=Ignavigranum ruoffiae TaxID=89093 RepID=UPI00206EA026|nr:GNAT family N-acetyltransferase [Ignavigranum ruoffiae]UPQ85980.1 GNAT family N-acetyltransferase [Ignavigranum ruoffiae]